MKTARPIMSKSDADEFLRMLSAHEVHSDSETLNLATLLVIATYLRILVEQTDPHKGH